jgi:hypothetical protein
VPPNVNDWITSDPDELILRHRAFWYSLRGQPETANATAVTLQIPLSQRLTVVSLNTMMQNIATGGTV